MRPRTSGNYVLAPMLAAITFLSALPAAAQSRDADAERLFREGQKLLEQGRVGQACPKFEAAYGKDGQLGTLINLAFCHKAQGANWSSWLEFREAELQAIALNRDDNRTFAHEQLAALEKLLPMLVLDGAKERRLTGVLVEDRRVPRAEAGIPFAVESGERKLTFIADGKKPTTLLVEVAQGSQPQHIVVPEMADAEPERPDASAPPIATSEGQERPSGAQPGEAAQASDAPRPGATQRLFGIVALGVGGAGAIAGTISGVMTLSSPCAGSTVGCTEEARALADKTQLISNISFAVAGVGLVAGLALLMTAPSASTPAAQPTALTVAPRIGLGWAGLDGTF